MVTDPNPIHILLADDDEDDRELFEEMLNDFSVSAFLTTVEDGEELMSKLSESKDCPPPHLIFLDINMPLKNGITCLQEIRNNKKFDGVPVFMFSTSQHIEDIETTYKYGANLYIPKALFFSEQKQIIEKLFSVHWKSYLEKIPKEKYVLGRENLA
jgi:CheY-like chemotaxis protein